MKRPSLDRFVLSYRIAIVLEEITKGGVSFDHPCLTNDTRNAFQVDSCGHESAQMHVAHTHTHTECILLVCYVLNDVCGYLKISQILSHRQRCCCCCCWEINFSRPSAAVFFTTWRYQIRRDLRVSHTIIFLSLVSLSLFKYTHFILRMLVLLQYTSTEHSSSA